MLPSAVTVPPVIEIAVGQLVKIGSAAVGGQGGGGRPDMAQAGGPNGDKLEAAFAAIKQAI